jgi:hypothetical protein
MYNGKDLSITSANDFPVDSNKSVFAVYSKTFIPNDIKFTQINMKEIKGNITSFEKINNNEFIAPVTYFRSNKYQIDIVKIDSLGEIKQTRTFPSLYKSVYIHHFIKLNNNRFVACGVSGDSVTLGKGYLMLIDADGNLIKEMTFGYDAVNFKKLVRFNDNQFAVLFDTPYDNKGYYVINGNFSILANFRFKAINYEITDFYLTSDKKLKFLAMINEYNDSLPRKFKYNLPTRGILITTEPDYIITKLDETTDVAVDTENKREFETYPNPATDYLEINLESINPTLKRGVDEGSDIQIFDMLGTVVASIHPMTGSHRMNIENLSPGIYFIKIGKNFEKFVKI